MSITSLLTGGIDSVITSLGGALDNLFTSDEERGKIKEALMRVRQDEHIKTIKLANEYEANITKRWQSDNAHIITRLVRPLVVVFLYTLFGAIVLSDGNLGDFKINSSYIPVLETLLVTVTVAYFGSRGFEKSAKIFKKA